MSLGHCQVGVLIMRDNAAIVEPTHASGAAAADDRQTKAPGHGSGRRDGGVGHGARGQGRRGIATSDSYGTAVVAIAGLLEKRQIHLPLNSY